MPSSYDPFDFSDPGSLFGSTPGSQTGGSGAGLPGFDGVQPATSGAHSYGSFDANGKPITVPAGQPSLSPGIQTYINQTPARRSQGIADDPDFVKQYGADFYEHYGNNGTPFYSAQSNPDEVAAGPGTNPTAPPTAPGPTGPATGAAPSPDFISQYQTKLNAISRAASPAHRSILSDQLARDLQKNLADAGHDVKWASDQELVVDGRRYTIGTWAPSGVSGYTPGEIPTDDMPTFTFDSLMHDTENPQLDEFISNLLANPESMNGAVTDSMKAKSKDELAGMEQQNQEQLNTLGRAYGIQESPWLAAQQLDSRRQMQGALVGKNRDIDITAATTNASDRRAAGALGLSWQGEKQTRAFTAASTAISNAAAMGDRLALRETVAQQAEKLNQSAESVLAQHVQFKLGEATKKYGIDVDAALRKYGIDVNSETSLTMNADNLAQADKHHLEDLAMSLQGLEIADASNVATHNENAFANNETARHNRYMEWVAGGKNGPAPPQ